MSVRQLPSRRTPLRIRRATIRDLDVLVLHRHRMFSDLDHWDQIDPPALAAVGRAYRPWLRERMRSGRLVAFLAEDPDRIPPLGSGCVWLREGPPRPRWTRGTFPYIMNMYTVPEARGRGVATRILKEALRWCRTQGFPRVVLNASDMGRPVYARVGFEPGSEMRFEFVPLHPAGGEAKKRGRPFRRRCD
ncbi:MAG: GNAT family N-acetyltransferase [Euryarchaeota archaeon]|nr:GNAT family N-acetyltransferase [Euryarchaeota archaeon]MDE1835787.1 GNAT family N-acetyltransferase [Euryarchaeota archaeon]MDE1880739.1 GNAT family N-acetyltransferase [Euryarchaeota archaeon]MDE2043978.1 GNAT family N-acetyltransferase [Thermoplasmata archaeon]